MLSDRFKNSFKVALAMVIAYGIALAMNWEKPFWAGLSVAFCSLATVGDSVNRGIQRATGTLLSGAFAFVLVGLFPQDRWLFLIAMGAVLALLTYKLTSGSRNMQIWFNAGFNLPIVVMLGGGEGLNTFNMIVLRVQETTLGVVVYSLVAALLWPRRGGESFEQTVRSISVNQRQLFQSFISAMFSPGDDEPAARLRTELSGQLAGLGERLEGAVYDNDQIWEVRQAWRQSIGGFSALQEALEQLGPAVSDLGGLDMPSLAPHLQLYETEIVARFAAIDVMLAGQPPQHKPRRVEWALDQQALGACTHLQRAAVLLCRDQFSCIDDLTRGLFESISAIRGYGVTRPGLPAKTMTPPFAVIDRDRLSATVRQSTAYWLTVLMILYVPAFPNPIGVLALVNAFAMILAAAPHVPSKILLLPVVLGSAFAGSLYIFVLPHLSGFGSLCALIFGATFLIGYVIHQPRAALAKNMGICMLIIILGVENHQSNNFIFFAEWFLGGALFVLILMLAWQLPVSFRPEVRLVALLARYFRSLEFLLSEGIANRGQSVSWFAQWRQASHLHEITALPKRIQAWSGMLSASALGVTKRDQFLSIGASMQLLSSQVQALQKVAMPAQAEDLMGDLMTEIEGCRAVLHSACGHLASGPETLDYAMILDRLEVSLSRFKERLDGAFEISADSTDLEEMYRLLGTYRKISNALLDVVRGFTPVDWSLLREARF